MAVLAVEEEKVSERLGGEGGVGEKVIKLPEPSSSIRGHVHEPDVVEGNGVKLLLAPRRHVTKGLLRSLKLVGVVLDCGLEVERFDQLSLLQELAVSYAPNIDTVGVASDAELRVFSNAPLDDNVNPLQGLSILLELVVAQGNIVFEISLVAERVEGVKVPLLGLLVQTLLVGDCCGSYDRLGVIWKAAVEERLASRQLVLLVLNCSLEHGDTLLVLLRVHLHCAPCRLRVHARLEETLSIVDLVLLNIRTDLDQLLISSNGPLEI
mmetsp:Transcript_18928/g.39405  ORF Transcript_18928/g.39405 Transcript_18928/m.39405 type:complete len:266 (+) Transcript_18928:1026-1823(+)